MPHSVAPPGNLKSLADAMAYLAAHTNYEATTDWSYKRLGFHIDAFRQFLERISSPHEKLPPVVHVAGTKGKGSTGLMLENIFRRAGYRTGLFQSPHLETITERIRLDGEPMADDDFAARLELLRPALDAFRAAVRPITFFEILTAMAITEFALGSENRRRPDVVILEVGLGGRLDATNVVPADVAIVTHIGFDHTDKLGDTLAAIAGEKAGILKPGKIGVIGPVIGEGVRETIAATAANLSPPPTMHWMGANDAFDIVRDEAAGVLHFTSDRLADAVAGPIPDRPRELDGNLACALHAALVLAREHSELALDAHAAMQAACEAALPGRMERFPVRVAVGETGGMTVVPVFLDVAHNADSLAAVAGYCRERSLAPVAVFGLNRDKATPDAVRAVAGMSGVIVTSVPGARGTEPAELAALWESVHGGQPRAEIVADPHLALDRALQLAAERAPVSGQRVVLVTGSFYLAGLLRPRLRMGMA